MQLDFPQIIENESARIVAALAANPDGRVPWSERWSVGTVAKHVGGTHHVVAKIIGDRPTASFALFSTLVVPDKSDPGLGAWITEGTAALVEQARAADPAGECWSWHPTENSVAFWIRRMAHEALVHRWDAEAGAGTDIVAMHPAVAADGIAEYLEVFVPTTRGLQNAPAGPTFEFACTDTTDRWFLELPEPGTRVVSREPVDAAITLRGTAEGLLLFVWGRQDPDAAGIEIAADASILARWRELVPPM